MTSWNQLRNRRCKTRLHVISKLSDWNPSLFKPHHCGQRENLFGECSDLCNVTNEYMYILIYIYNNSYIYVYSIHDYYMRATLLVYKLQKHIYIWMDAKINYVFRSAVFFSVGTSSAPYRRFYVPRTESATFQVNHARPGRKPHGSMVWEAFNDRHDHWGVLRCQRISFVWEREIPKKPSPWN